VSFLLAEPDRSTLPPGPPRRDTPHTYRASLHPVTCLVTLILALSAICNPALCAEEGGFPGISVSVEQPLGLKSRIGAWTPLWISIQNTGEDYAGKIRLRTGRATYERKIELPAGSNRRLTLNLVPYSSDPRYEVSLVRRGAPVPVTTEQLTLQIVPSDRQLIILLAAEDEPPFKHRNILTDNCEVVEADAVSSVLEDPRSLDAADIVILSDTAFPRTRLAQRRALATWVESGGALVLPMLQSKADPRETLRNWYLHETGYTTGPDLLIRTSPAFRDLGWLPFGWGRIVYLTKSTIDHAHQEKAADALATELSSMLRADVTHAMLSRRRQPIQEALHDVFGATLWPSRLRTKWFLSAGVYVLVMAAFLLPILKRTTAWKLYLGVAVASACFVAVLVFVVLPDSPVLVRNVAIVHAKSGSAVTIEENWAELCATRDGRIVVGSNRSADLRPVYASWEQLSQAEYVTRKSTASAEYELTMMKGERRWFRLSASRRLNVPIRASLVETEQSQDGEELLLELPYGLPEELNSAILVTGNRAILVGQILQNEPLSQTLARPQLSIPTAMRQALGQRATEDPELLKIVRHLLPPSDRPRLIGWSAPPNTSHIHGNFAAVETSPTLYVIELETK